MHNKSTSIKESWIQDRNNRIVIERALRRRNLDKDWKIIQIDPDNPRRIAFFPMNEEIPETFDSDAEEMPNDSVQIENFKPSIRPTTVGLQPVEHRIEIGPIDDIFRIKSLSVRLQKMHRVCP